MQPANDRDLPLPGRLSPALLLYPLGHLAVELYSSALSVMWPLLASRFALAYGAVGLLNMIFRSATTLPQLGFAHVSDRHGSRLPAVAGLLVVALGMSLIGLAPGVLALAIILALAALGSAAFHPAATAYMSRTLPRRHATAVAILMFGGNVGASLGPLIAARLMGGRGLVASTALLPLGLLIAPLILIFIPADSGAARRAQRASGPKAAIPPAMYLLMVACAGQSWVDGSLSSYLSLLYTARGLSLGAASSTLFVIAAAGAAGVFVGGALSDRIPRWRVVVLAEALTVPLYIGTVLLGRSWALLVPAGLGFVSALSYPVTVTMGQEMMPNRTSLASAMTMGVSWVIGSLGVALNGVLADHIGMQASLLLNAAVPLTGMAAMFTLHYLQKRRARIAAQWG